MTDYSLRTAIRQRLWHIIELDFALEDITDDLEFIEYLDSLDMVELVITVEQEFEIEVSDVEAERCQRVGDAVDLIYEKMKNG